MWSLRHHSRTFFPLAGSDETLVRKSVYGGGFGYAFELEDSAHINRTNVEGRIAARDFDVIVYGSLHRSNGSVRTTWAMPPVYWDVVASNYPRSKILFFDGEDLRVVSPYTNEKVLLVAQKGILFIRESLNALAACRQPPLDPSKSAERLSRRAKSCQPTIPAGAVSIVPEYAQCAASTVFLGQKVGDSLGMGRLNSPTAWSAGQNIPGQWWQMDAGAVVTVVGVQTQGRARGQVAGADCCYTAECCADQRVTGYKVSVSAEGLSWAWVENGIPFEGNMEKDGSTVSNVFSSPVQAKYVRIVVTAWEVHISLRAGLLISEA
jgi:hypothetical protein